MTQPWQTGKALARCLEQGQALLAAQAWHAAIECYTRGLSIDSDHAELLHDRAWCHLHLDAWQAAQTDLETLLRLHPGHARGLALLGRVRLAQGALDAGIECLDLAWMADPQDPDIAAQALRAWLLRPGAEFEVTARARILARNRQLSPECAHDLQQVLRCSDSGQQALRQLWAQLCTEAPAASWMFEAWFQTCRQTRQAEEMALAATLWLRHEPGNDRALHALMHALSALGDLHAVLPLILARAQTDPGDIETMLDLARTLMEAPDDALRDAGLLVLAHAQSLTPDHAQVWLYRGQYHAKIFMHEVALSDFSQAMRLAPAMWSAHTGRVRSLAVLGRHQEATQALHALIPTDAARQIEWDAALALILRIQGRLQEAESVLRRSLGCGGGHASKWELGSVLLAQGRYAKGWAQWRGLSEVGPRPLLNQLIQGGATPWRGDLAQARNRRLVVVSETGLGDALQFGRFVPVLQRHQIEVVLLVPESLRQVFNLTQSAWVVVSEISALPPVDLVCALWDLPMLLDVHPDATDRWGSAHYLQASDAQCDAVGQALGARTRFRVALAWRGRRSPLAERSIALERFAALALPEVEWFSLQQELLPGAETEAAVRMGLRHAGWSLEAAALALTHMDSIVSVDTVFCHLAGALGRPAKILLPLPCDWRWGSEGTHTPWYPSAILLRQEAPGDWSAPLKTLETQLQEALQSWSRLRPPAPRAPTRGLSPTETRY